MGEALPWTNGLEVTHSHSTFNLSCVLPGIELEILDEGGLGCDTSILDCCA